MQAVLAWGSMRFVHVLCFANAAMGVVLATPIDYTSFV
jgi:hypothetical protein